MTISQNRGTKRALWAGGAVLATLLSLGAADTARAGDSQARGRASLVVGFDHFRVEVNNAYRGSEFRWQSWERREFERRARELAERERELERERARLQRRRERRQYRRDYRNWWSDRPTRPTRSAPNPYCPGRASRSRRG